MSVEADQATTHTCMSIINNFKAATQDYQSLIDAGTPWTDPIFQPNQDALYWEDYHNDDGPMFEIPNFMSTYAFKRACSIPGKTVLGDDTTYYSDIN